MIDNWHNTPMLPLMWPPKWAGRPMHMLRLRTILLNDPTFRALLAKAGRDKE